MNKFYGILGITVLSLTLASPSFSYKCSDAEASKAPITDASASNGCPLQVSQEDMFNANSSIYKDLGQPINAKEVQDWLGTSARQKIREAMGKPTHFVLISADRIRSDGPVSCVYRISKAVTSPERQCLALQQHAKAAAN